MFSREQPRLFHIVSWYMLAETSEKISQFVVRWALEDAVKLFSCIGQVLRVGILMVEIIYENHGLHNATGTEKEQRANIKVGRVHRAFPVFLLIDKW